MKSSSRQGPRDMNSLAYYHYNRKKIGYPSSKMIARICSSQQSEVKLCKCNWLSCTRKNTLTKKPKTKKQGIWCCRSCVGRSLKLCWQMIFAGISHPSSRSMAKSARGRLLPKVIIWWPLIYCLHLYGSLVLSNVSNTNSSSLLADKSTLNCQLGVFHGNSPRKAGYVWDWFTR